MTNKRNQNHFSVEECACLDAVNLSRHAVNLKWGREATVSFDNQPIIGCLLMPNANLIWFDYHSHFHMNTENGGCVVEI